MGILDAILKGKGASSKGEPSEPDGDEAEPDDDGDACADEVADILKVDRHDKEDLKTALRGLIRAELRAAQDEEE